jgi:hypothetical protein
MAIDGLKLMEKGNREDTGFAVAVRATAYAH